MTLQSHSLYTPPLMSDLPPTRDARAVALGKLIKEKRLDLGLNRPTFVREMARHGEEITPDYLNKIESGTAYLSRASLEVREGIRVVLGFSREDWHAATGLYAAELPSPDPLADFPAPLYKKRDEVYMPEGLLEAIKLFGDVPEYAGLRDPEVQRQLARVRGFNGGPQTAGQWLAFFQANKPWITNKD
jgi:hypothetical protein